MPFDTGFDSPLRNHTGMETRLREILLFGSPSCKACKTALADLKADGVDVSYIDCAQSQDTAVRFKIESLPTICVVEGARTVCREEGWSPKIKDRVLLVYGEG